MYTPLQWWKKWIIIMSMKEYEKGKEIEAVEQSLTLTNLIK